MIIYVIAIDLSILVMNATNGVELSRFYMETWITMHPMFKAARI